MEVIQNGPIPAVIVTNESGGAEVIVSPNADTLNKQDYGVTIGDVLYNPSNPNLVYTQDYFQRGIQNGRIPAVIPVMICDPIHEVKTVQIIDENNNFACDSDNGSVKDKSVTNSSEKDSFSGAGDDFPSNASIGTTNDGDYIKIKVLKKRYSFHTRKDVPLKVKIIRCIFMATILTAGLFFLLFPPVYHWQLMRIQRESNSTTS